MIKMSVTLCLCASVFPLSAEASDSAKAAYNNHCRTCHSVKPGDNRLGPSLANIVGKTAGTTPGYDYSSSLADGQIVWDRETMDAFLHNPELVAPGNNMRTFRGLTDKDVRALILKFLGYETASGN